MGQITFNKDDSKKFFILGHYHRSSSNNIAVLGDKDKYKKVLEEYMNIWAKSELRMIKVNDYKYTFILDDIETTLVLIETAEDLYKHTLFYSKYI